MLPRALRSPYLKAIGLLTGTQGIALLVPILAAPVLGRLYAPAEYAPLALYMSLGSVLAACATWQMHQAIIAEPNEKAAKGMAALCLIITGISTVLAAIAALILFSAASYWPEWQSIRYWLLLLPMTTMFGGISAAIINYAHKYARFTFFAWLNVVMVCITVTLSITLGLAGWSSNGLLVSYFIGQTSVFAVTLIYAAKLDLGLRDNGRKRLRALLKRHQRFATFTLPSELVSTVNLNAPLYALSYFGMAAPLGAFNRARQLASVPFTVLGSSVGQVFRQRAARDLAQYGTCRPVFMKTALTLSAIGLPVSLALMLAAPLLFEIYLGARWRLAGEIAQILAPMLCLRLVASPLSAVYQLRGKQRTAFAVQCGAFAVLLVGMAFISAREVIEPLTIVSWFSGVYFSVYGLTIALAYKFAAK